MVVPESGSAEFVQVRSIIESPVLEDWVNPWLHVTGSCINLLRGVLQDLCRHNISDGVAIDDKVKYQGNECCSSVHPVFKLGSECDLQHKHGHLEVAPIDYYCRDKPRILVFLLILNNTNQNQCGQ